MRSSLAAVAVAALLTGCTYQPLASEENLPELSDAVLDHDILVVGEAWMPFGPWTDDGFQQQCEVSYDVQGWAAQVSAADAGCAGCSENYTLALTENDDSDCDWVIPGAPTIAITPKAFFPPDRISDWSDYYINEYVPEGADGTAIAFARSNWDVRGERDEFDALFGVFNHTDEPPDGYARSLFVSEIWFYNTQNYGYGSLRMDLLFLQ
jgi:hypothetical protein